MSSTSATWNKLFSLLILVLICGTVLIGQMLKKSFGFLDKISKEVLKNPPGAKKKGCGTKGEPLRPAAEGFQAGTGGIALPTVNTEELKCAGGWELCEGAQVPTGYITETSLVKVAPDDTGFDLGDQLNTLPATVLNGLQEATSKVAQGIKVVGLATGMGDIPIDPVTGLASSAIGGVKSILGISNQSQYLRTKTVIKEKDASGKLVTLDIANAPEKIRGILCCYNDNPYIGARKLDSENEPEPTPPVRNPRADITDLDVAYEDYDYNEDLEAQKELAEAQKQFPDIKIQEPQFFNVGYMLQNLDANIESIPWDFDNKDYQQSEALWGTVLPIVSKCIFMRAYAEQVLSNLNNTTVTDKGKCIWKSLILGQEIDVKDPRAAKALEMGESMAMGIAPMMADRVQEFAWNHTMRALDSVKEARLAKDLNAKPFSKASEMLRASMKNLTGSAGMKRISTALSKRIGPYMARLMKSYFIKMLIRGIAMLSSALGLSIAADAAAVASLGALAPLAAAAKVVLTAVSNFISATQTFMMILMIILPPILEKYLNEGGVCPNNAKSLKKIIPEAANTLISIFVPFFGDILDLFYPYLCFESNGRPLFKIRLKGQPYYDDTTLSAFYHKNRDPMGADDDPAGIGYRPPPLREVSYDWCNFAHPVMLDRMAQFYYTNSLLHPFEDDDGNTCIQYIVEFYGVIASSELSCDVACKMKTICYEPFTGQNYRETYFCDPLDPDTSLAEQVCYRRFYFFKRDDDPQGLFTVTGCTNQNNTAPKAETTSFDSGDYVPALPKQFKMQSKDPMADQGNLWKSIAVNIGVGAASMGIGMGAGKVAGRIRSGKPLAPKFGRNGKPGSAGIFGKGGDGPAISKGRGRSALAVEMLGAAGGGILPVALGNSIEQFDKLLGIIPPDDEDGSFLTGDPKRGYTLVTNNEYWYIEQGPAIEDAVGYKPYIKFCDPGAAKKLIDPTRPELGSYEDIEMPIGQCKHYLTVRDTVDQYQKVYPKKHIKQIVGVEPRRGGACYYKWKEVEYKPETNLEVGEPRVREVIVPYEIRNKATCVYEPKGLTFPKEKVIAELTAVYDAVAKLEYATLVSNRTAELTKADQIVTQNKRAGAIARLNESMVKVRAKAEAAAASIRDKQLPAKSSAPTLSDYATAAAELDKALVEGAQALRLAVNAQQERIRAAGSFSFILDTDTDTLPAAQPLAHAPGPAPASVSSSSCTTAPAPAPGPAPAARIRTIDHPKYGVISVKNAMPIEERERLPVTNPFRNEIIWPTRRMALQENGMCPMPVPKYPLKPFDVPRALPAKTTLGGDNCPASVCDSKDQIETLMKGFNDANRDNGRQIMKVLRAWTPFENRCDYDVEMMRTYKLDKATMQLAPAPAPASSTVEHKTIHRETVSILVKPSPAPSPACSFVYASDGSAEINSGTFIQDNTPDLSGYDVSGGISYYDSVVRTLKRAYNAIIAPIAQERVMDKSIDSTKRTYETSDKVLETVYTNQTLVGCPEKKCSDPDMLRMMVDHYNEKNGSFTDPYGTVTERYAVSVLKAGVASGNQCDVMLKVRENLYMDILDTASVDNQSTRATAVRFNVAFKDRAGPGGTCRFDLRKDLSGGVAFKEINTQNDFAPIGLRYDSSTLSPEVEFPVRRVDCSSPSVLNAVKAKIEDILNKRDEGISKIHNITKVTKTFAASPTQCNYEMKKDMTNTGGTKPFKCLKDDYKTYTKCTDYTTYVNADFTMNPDGTFSLKDAREYDLIDQGDADPVTGAIRLNTFSLKNGQIITNPELIYLPAGDGDPPQPAPVDKLPLMYFDPKGPNRRVNKRIYTLPAK